MKAKATDRPSSQRRKQTGAVSQAAAAEETAAEAAAEAAELGKNWSNIFLVFTVGMKAILIGGLEHFFIFSIQLGMSSSQVTNSYFSEGWLNHQSVKRSPSEPIRQDPHQGSAVHASTNGGLR